MAMYTSSFEKMKSIPAERFTFVSISRGGVPLDFPHPTKEYLQLAPSWDLVKDWKSGKITWDEYTKRYKAETNYDSTILKFREYLDELHMAESSKDIVVLCYCIRGECHRHIVGYDVNAIELSDYLIGEKIDLKRKDLNSMYLSIPGYR